MSTESVMPSSHLILCHPLLFLPSVSPHLQGNLSNDLALHIRWPKYWNFSFSISPSYEYSGLISFGSHWFDLLAVQGTLKTSTPTPQFWKHQILQHSAFFMVQLSHPYVTTGKTIALTIRIFVSKVTSLLFNRLSKFVIAFLPRSKGLLISWLQGHSILPFWNALRRDSAYLGDEHKCVQNGYWDPQPMVNVSFIFLKYLFVYWFVCTGP